MRSIYYKLAVFSIICLAPVAYAEKDPHDYNYVAQDLFWNQLYEGGSWTLYCGYRFEQDRKSPEGYTIGIDHIYATEWMFDYLNCNNRSQCYSQNIELFRQMESDLHNLYPAWTAITVHRAGRVFGNVNGEEQRFDACDVKWKAGVFEPRDISKGNIARSIFYMHTQYSAPVPGNMMEEMKQWNKDDPPSDQEKTRNDRIQRLQGLRNPYIDNPELAEGLQ